MHAGTTQRRAVTARSGGTTDHAAERNAGSGQAGSVTERSDGASPCWTRTAWSGAGTGRTSPTTLRPGITQRAAIAASVGPTRTAPTTRGQGYASERRSRERGAVHVPTLAQDRDNDQDDADGNLASPPRLCFTHHPGRRFARAQGVSAIRRVRVAHLLMAGHGACKANVSNALSKQA